MTDDVARLAEAEVVLVRSKTKCTAEWIEQAPKLKLIIRGGVGLDNIDARRRQGQGHQGHQHAQGASSVAVAELAFALMLAVPNRLIEAHNAMKEGKFLKKEIKRTELFGKTLGLVGVGRIGRRWPSGPRAFGMTRDRLRPVRQGRRDVAILVTTLDELFAAGRLHLAAHAAHRRDPRHDQQGHRSPR